MTRRPQWKMVLLTTLALVLVTLLTAGFVRGALPGRARPTPDYFFGANMVRAEALLKVGGVLQDYRLDRGKVRSVTGSTLMVAERDGLVVPVAVAPDARIQLNGRVVGLPALRRGMEVMTIREGDSPAEIVQATRR